MYSFEVKTSESRVVACQAQTVWCFVVVVVSEKDVRNLDDCDRGGVNGRVRG